MSDWLSKSSTLMDLIGHQTECLSAGFIVMENPKLRCKLHRCHWSREVTLLCGEGDLDEEKERMVSASNVAAR